MALSLVCIFIVFLSSSFCKQPYIAFFLFQSIALPVRLRIACLLGQNTEGNFQYCMVFLA